MSDLVRCLTNDKLEFQYDVLESIINKPELLDVPIVVYSIAGPEKTGKSFLLNLLWYELRKKYNYCSEDENDQVEIPMVFDFSCCCDFVTKGIFMTTQPIYVPVNARNSKIAVFLMDTQGIQSGDKDEYKEGDIFTISLALSYLQIINVTNRLKYVDIDAYAGLTLFAESALSSMPHKQKNLTIIVRDWFYEEYEYGYNGGNSYYGAIKNQGSRSTELAKQCLNMFFGKIDCFLAPCPGRVVERSTPKYMNDIDDDARNILSVLSKGLFSKSHIMQAYTVAPKGKSFLQLAKTVTTALSSESKPAAPDCSYKNFLAYIMENKISECCERYKTLMAEWLKFTAECKNMLQSKHDSIKQKITGILKQKCPPEESEAFVEELHQLLDNEHGLIMSMFIEGNQMVENFPKKWSEKIKQKGNFLEKEVYEHFEDQGKKFIQSFKLRLEIESLRNGAITKFIEKMNENFIAEIERRRKNSIAAGTVAAIGGGAVGGALLVLIPPLGAAAVAAELATEAVIGLTATGLGFAGGAAVGPIGYAIGRFTRRSRIEPPDLRKFVDEDEVAETMVDEDSLTVNENAPLIGQ